jgi:hypothetical protein
MRHIRWFERGLGRSNEAVSSWPPNTPMQVRDDDVFCRLARAKNKGVKSERRQAWSIEKHMASDMFGHDVSVMGALPQRHQQKPSFAMTV